METVENLEIAMRANVAQLKADMKHARWAVKKAKHAVNQAEKKDRKTK